MDFIRDEIPLMASLSALRIRPKATLFIVSVCVIVSGISGWISYYHARASLEDYTFRQLTSIQSAKTSQVSEYFALIEAQVRSLAKNPTTIAATAEFKRGFSELSRRSDERASTPQSVARSADLSAYYSNDFLPALNEGFGTSSGIESVFPVAETARYLQYHYISNNHHPLGEKHQLEHADDQSLYSRVHAQFHDVFKEYQNEFGYYDIFLIDNRTGDIVYSVFKEVDFATNLRSGPFRKSNLADAFDAANELTTAGEVAFIDFDYYRPSYGAPAAFVSTLVYDNEVPIGTLVFQFPVDKLNAIMTDDGRWREDGLGETGETYLVGADFSMRSVSRFLIEDREGYFDALRDVGYPEKTIALLDHFDSSILLQNVHTPAAMHALEGGRDIAIIEDYRGVSVLSSFGPVAFGDQQWALFADVDEAEAFAAVDALNRILLLSGFALALVMAALSTFVARRLVEPIVDLAEAAEEVGEGNFEVQLAINSSDEMGELTANFNTMVSSLREQREAIEFKNTENTKLLLNVLPQPIAERLKDGETQIADAFPSASVVFTDLVGFTNWSRGLPPMVVLTMLDDLFGSFDEVASELGVEKIKTIGDAYMAVCGLPVPNAKHAETMALLAGRILICLEEFNARNGTQLRMRVGLHCGPVVAGVIGTSKFIYDLWGETINMASRMESTGLPDEIQISEAFYEALDGSYEVTPRGEIEVKGVGTVSTYLLGKRAVRSTVDE